MTLTAAQRSEINRQNAARSTGPKSEEGKSRARWNALKHGLRADAPALPGEDSDAVAARAHAWNEFYRPESPAAQHLVNQCVQATLLSDRCHRYHAEALAKQVREAEKTWDDTRDDEVARLRALLLVDPGEAVRRLRQTSDGCQAMILRWEHLDSALTTNGRWNTLERDEAIRLLGLPPESATLKDNPGAWKTRFYNLLCHARPTPEAIRWHFEPAYFPEAYRGVYTAERHPDRAACQAVLRAMIAEELACLRATFARLDAAFDAPDRAGASARALILHDGPSARLFLRYHAESRTAFQRAYSSLVQTLARDAQSASELDSDGAPAPISPNEPKSADPPPVSPNEPKSAPVPAPVPVVRPASVPSPAPFAVFGPDSEVVSASVFVALPAQTASSA